MHNYKLHTQCCQEALTKKKLESNITHSTHCILLHTSWKILGEFFTLKVWESTYMAVWKFVISRHSGNHLSQLYTCRQRSAGPRSALEKLNTYSAIVTEWHWQSNSQRRAPWNSAKYELIANRCHMSQCHNSLQSGPRTSCTVTFCPA